MKVAVAQSIRKADENAVYLTRDATAFEISHEVTSYAEAQYFELSDLKEVDVTLRARGQQKIRLYQGTDGNWTVEGLEGEPIDQSRVRSLLAAVKGARMVRPVGKTIKPEFGLDAPAAQVSITNGAETIDLSVGAAFGDFRYVKASGKSHVVLVRKYTLDSLLDFDPTQLIDLSQKKTPTPGDRLREDYYRHPNGRCRTHPGCGRLAPTPTGRLHLGNLRTAWLAELASHSFGHRFVLRIDDLDPKATIPGMIEAQIDDLTFGIKFDEGYNVGGESGPYPIPTLPPLQSSAACINELAALSMLVFKKRSPRRSSTA